MLVDLIFKYIKLQHILLNVCKWDHNHVVKGRVLILGVRVAKYPIRHSHRLDTMLFQDMTFLWIVNGLVNYWNCNFKPHMKPTTQCVQGVASRSKPWVISSVNQDYRGRIEVPSKHYLSWKSDLPRQNLDLFEKYRGKIEYTEAEFK